LPLTIFFLLVAVGMLGYKARHRRGYIPLFIGIAGAVAIVAGKFYLDEDYLSKAGISLLVAASVWNAWPRKGATGMAGVHLEPYDKNKH
jgi:drug/metabolite transporter (DMT)-like permease